MRSSSAFARCLAYDGARGIGALSFVCDACLGLREAKSGLAPLLPLFCGVGLLLAALSRFSAFSRLLSLFDEAGLSETASLVLRVLGVGYLGEMGAELCRDLGAASLGGRLELFARVEILVLCIPSITEVLEKALGLLS